MSRARRYFLKARRAAERLAGPLARRRARREAGQVRLDAVQRRIQIFLAALYGAPIQVAEREGAGRSGIVFRIADRLRPDPDALLATNDGQRVLLPHALPTGGDRAAALARYRLLAVEQAERLQRGTALDVPADPLERDLYLLRESAATDAAILARAPGLAASLAAERAAALASRPPMEKMSAADREVERLVRQALAGEPLEPHADAGASVTPDASRAWARATAERVRRLGAYLGVPAVPLWGRAPMPLASAEGAVNPYAPKPQGIADADARGTRPGDSGVEPRQGDPQGSASATDGAPRDDAPADENGVPTPKVFEEGDPDAVTFGDSAAAGPAVHGPIAHYPEWDHHAGRHGRRVTVRHGDQAGDDAAWSDAVLASRAALVRQVRERFERLRAQRQRLHRQREGEELDLDAVVRAASDLRAEGSVDDRLYSAVRPARRPIAIALLVDASGSTEAVVADGLTIIDVEKTAVLLAGVALDALGDRWTALAFSGRGADDVRVRTLKEFGERGGEAMRARVAALAPEGFTRLGAVMRHATALLEREHASHRLLLLLSDGRPNDVDGYQGDYAIEDARQSVHEARARGVIPFCLTVDHEEHEYLPHVFGPGYAVLRNPAGLPRALLDVVRQLLTS